jgi:tetratricopeptide (TPR) repeat protein
MNSVPPPPSPPRPARWRRYLLAAAIATALAAGVPYGYRAWLRSRAPQPPEVALEAVGPGVAEDIAAARAIVQKVPYSAAAWGHLGLMLQLYSFFPEAVTCFAQAEALEPNNPRWPYLQGLILARSSDPELTVPLLRRAGALNGPALTPRLRLGEVLFQAGRIDEAEAEFQEVLQHDPENPRALLGLGRVANSRNDLKGAQKLLLRAAARAPKARAIHLLLAEVDERLGDKLEADAERRLAASLPADSSWPDPYVILAEGINSEPGRVATARRMREQGQLGDARKLLQDTLVRYPQSYSANLELGRVLTLLVDLPAAASAYREAARLRPDSVDAVFELGEALHSDGKVSDAASAFRQALRIKPRHAEARFFLGVCLERQGDVAAALTEYRAAVADRPDLAIAHRSLGILLAREGQDGEALESLQRAIDLDPSDGEAKRWLKTVRARVLPTGPPAPGK